MSNFDCVINSDDIKQCTNFTELISCKNCNKEWLTSCEEHGITRSFYWGKIIPKLAKLLRACPWKGHKTFPALQFLSSSGFASSPNEYVTLKNDALYASNWNRDFFEKRVFEYDYLFTLLNLYRHRNVQVEELDKIIHGLIVMYMQVSTIDELISGSNGIRSRILDILLSNKKGKLEEYAYLWTEFMLLRLERKVYMNFIHKANQLILHLNNKPGDVDNSVKATFKELRSNIEDSYNTYVFEHEIFRMSVESRPKPLTELVRIGQVLEGYFKKTAAPLETHKLYTKCVICKNNASKKEYDNRLYFCQIDHPEYVCVLCLRDIEEPEAMCPICNNFKLFSNSHD